MILIADSGSTKTSWRFIDSSGKVTSFSTEGLNPYYKTAGEIEQVLKENLLPQLTLIANEVNEIYFYGAGCSVPVKCKEVEKAIKSCFIKAKIEVEHDILGAARACCMNEKGIVCILGTGSNSCLYDGQEITEIIGGLGFNLGDEGSGAIIGKSVVAAYLNKEMPEELRTDFFNTYKLDKETIYDKVYQKPNFNRFLATFSLFAGKHKNHPFIHSLLENAFELFLMKHVCRYPNYRQSTIHFVGSVGYYFKDIINELCKKKGIRTGKFILAPVEELVKFHLIQKIPPKRD